MNSIDLLEHGGATPSWPFCVRHQGELIPLPDPRARHYQWILMALSIRHVPGTPDNLPEWKRDLVFEHWCAAWDLPPFAEARRLAYLSDNYRAALSNDLAVYTGLDLGDLWRARRWTKLLDLIDRLPGHSWYSSSVANDEDHAKMIAESVAARRKDPDAAEDKGPALTSWTPEVAVLTSILDATRRVEHATYAAQHGKKAGEPPKASPRPVTALERAIRSAELNARKSAHERLVARVLPQKAAVKG